MLKKLAQIQLIGLSAIWLYVAFNLYTLEAFTTAVPPAAAEEVYGEAVEEDEKVDLTAPKATAVEKIPTSKPAVVSNAESVALTFPVAGYDHEAIISFFGDKRGKTRRHKGVDIKAPRHTALVAVADGKIEKISNRGSAGKAVYLRANDGRLYFYAHLEDWSVEEDTKVKAGEEIGTVGDSGNAKGTTPHLHFEVLVGKKKQSLDPLPLLTGESLP